MGRCGGQVVRVLAFYSDNPSSNPAEAYSFLSVKFVFEKKENKQKEAGDGPFLTIPFNYLITLVVIFVIELCQQIRLLFVLFGLVVI